MSVKVIFNWSIILCHNHHGHPYDSWSMSLKHRVWGATSSQCTPVFRRFLINVSRHFLSLSKSSLSDSVVFSSVSSSSSYTNTKSSHVHTHTHTSWGQLVAFEHLTHNQCCLCSVLVEPWTHWTILLLPVPGVSNTACNVVRNRACRPLATGEQCDFR